MKERRKRREDAKERRFFHLGCRLVDQGGHCRIESRFFVGGVAQDVKNASEANFDPTRVVLI